MDSVYTPSLNGEPINQSNVIPSTVVQSIIIFDNKDFPPFGYIGNER